MKQIMMLTVALVAAVIVYADTETVDGVTWNYQLGSSGVSIVGATSGQAAISTATSGAITIPSEIGGQRVVTIGNYAFRDCSFLTSVTIPDGVTSIGSYAFQNCSGLTSVTIPGSVTRIGNGAFYGCSGLTSVVIPNSVTSIGADAFRGCNGLADATGLVIVRDVLYGYTGESDSVTIPYGVTSIGANAFQNCRGLTSVTIPDGVTSIGNYAFHGCSGLTSVSIPASVRSIGVAAFAACSGLTGFLVADANTVYESVSGLLLTKNGRTQTLIAGIKGDVTIPDSVTSIGNYAFQNCSGLTSVTIPDSVTSIGNYAFQNCSGLTSVTIPDSVASIGGYAFSGCSGLTSVTIPGSVASIGGSAFFGCSGLTSVMIPDGVTSIGLNAFMNCSGLISVTIPASVTSIGANAFRGCRRDVTVYVPALTGEIIDILVNMLPATATIIKHWPPSTWEYEVVDGKATIIGHTFSGGDLVIPATIGGCPVVEIGDSASAGCSNLTSITIPGGVTSIGAYAFYDCSDLTSVTIPDSVTSIGDLAFYGCSALTSVTIPGSVTNIGYLAFGGCGAVSRVEYLGAPPYGIASSGITDYGIQSFPYEYAAQWKRFVSMDRFAGYVSSRMSSVTIVSSKIRENDPTIMDVVYKVTSVKPTVRVRALVFEDGERSFAKVLRPETFVDGTAVNVGDSITANEEHALAWQVSNDWATRLAKLKFEVLSCEGVSLLPMEWMTIPATEGRYGPMKFSWNAHSSAQVLDALFWLYADKDPGLTLENGVLKNGDTQLVSGTMVFGQNASGYVFSKMGCSLLSGDALNYVNDEARLGLSPSGARQYAYKIVGDGE